MKMEIVKTSLALTLCFIFALFGRGEDDVTYDGRSLIINGSRKILFSGSIHYPRSTPEMWPSLIAKAKEGGINVIQTYVFWNVHEPIQDQYNFVGRHDLVGFIKEIQSQGLYVSLRIGPFVEAEWKYGGLPFWLHDIPGIIFRSDNEPFKYHMKFFVSKIVSMMKAEGLYASQRGPIILSQVENEYKNVEQSFGEKGPPYVRWAASMAVGLKTGVPWMMCKQDDAPDPVINACNGMNCGETFAGPNSPNKPALWTENWTSFIQVYGGEPYIRSAEDIAFAVALFIAAKNGSFVNYYMYHGGTNFGRSASSYIITGYYDQAPLDEYGLIRQPKWGHLKELHAAIKLCEETLLSGHYSTSSLGNLQEVHVFQGTAGKCVAFLANRDRNQSTTVLFGNIKYGLPARSISILPDCKNVIFNTAKVTTQYSIRSTTTVQNFSHSEGWEAFMDGVANYDQTTFSANELLEQLNVTKDETDYLWYSVSYENKAKEEQHVLNVETRAHVLHAFINDVYVGKSHGNYSIDRGVSPILSKPVSLTEGKNNISLLSVMVGSPDSGAFLEHRVAGLQRVRIESSTSRAIDISQSRWGYKVGLLGEKLEIYSPKGSNKVTWGAIGTSVNQPLTWYKTTFDTPAGDDPVVVNLSTMGKGEAWINGESIGRYWVSYKTPKDRPSQTLYHVPSGFLNRSQNLLVLFEEMSGNPLGVSLETISVTIVCGVISESQPPALFDGSQPKVNLQCQNNETISAINFASYGTPLGNCEKYVHGSCHSPMSLSVVNKACLGKTSCSVIVSAETFRGDPCPGITKSLLVAASCH